MTIKTIAVNDWYTQPWQNGGGITHQLARCDDDKGMLWRISIAEVASDGPFSRFDNIERIILLLEGKGFSLFGTGDDPQVLDEILQPFAFAGETEILCKLVQGPVRDFNLMSRRHEVRASLEVLNLSQQRLQVELATDTVIYVVNGYLTADLNGAGFHIEAENALWFSNEQGDVSLISDTLCQLLVIKITQEASG